MDGNGIIEVTIDEALLRFGCAAAKALGDASCAGGRLAIGRAKELRGDAGSQASRCASVTLAVILIELTILRAGQSGINSANDNSRG